MSKWKLFGKRAAAGILSAMLIMGTAVTSYAFVDENAEASKVEETAETTETTEAVAENATTETTDTSGTPFTDPGNGELQDDFTDDSSKEFLTVTTKNNNTFYIVIDRSATSENVYMLSQIDENDLEGFLEETGEDTKTPSVVLEETEATKEPVVSGIPTEAGTTDGTGTGTGTGNAAGTGTLDGTATGTGVDADMQVEKEQDNSTLLLGGSAAVLAAAVAAGWYFKIYRPKHRDDDPDEGLESGDDEE